MSGQEKGTEAEQRKTLKGIVAELRMGDDGGKPAYRIGRPDKVEISVPSGQPIRSMVIEEVHISELAEWIEAAAKREGGNAAALREAIEPWVAFGEWLLENVGKEGLGAAIREYGPIIRQRLEELRAALSAPARNCDKYDNFNDALRQFVKERPDTKKIDEQGRSVATAETYCVFANWLLTPAVERKGECDA